MKKYLQALAAIIALGVTSIASASTVTIGDLTYNSTKNLITNDVTGQQYLGFDVVAGLSYADTVAAVSAGGAYEDYRLATQADAIEFYDAIAIDSRIGNSAPNEFGFVSPDWSDGAFGPSWTFYSDRVYFLSEVGGIDRVGHIIIDTSGGMQCRDTNKEAQNCDIFINFAFRTPDTVDGYIDFSNNNGVPFGFLLVKNVQTVSAVPVPAAAFMFAPAVLGFLGLRRRAKQA